MFVGSRPADDEDAVGDSVVEALLSHLATAAAAADRSVRARAAATLAACLNSQPADAELSEAIADKLAKAMAARLTDRAPAVRAAAATVLARLADPGPSGDYAGDAVTAAYLKLLRTERHRDVRRAAVACVPLCASSLPALLDRTRDVDDGVRRAVYVVFTEKVPVAALPIAARALLLARGLRDRAPAVAAAARGMLVRWLDAGCGGDVGALLGALDVESHETEAEAALRALDGAGRLHPAALARAAADAGVGLHRPSSGGDGSTPPMAPEEALLWRVVCALLAEAGAERGAAAAAASGPVAAAAAASAGDALAALEAALPPTVAALCDLVRDAAAAGEGGLFAASQLARLVSSSADLSDEAGRAAAVALLAGLLADVAGPAGMDAAWTDALVGLARAAHAAPAEVAPPALVSAALRLPAGATAAAAAVADIAEDSDAAPPTPVTGDVAGWRGCLGAARVLLRCLLPRAAPGDAYGPPGSPLETVADLGPALVAPAMLHVDGGVRADAAEAAGLLVLAAGRRGGGAAAAPRGLVAALCAAAAADEPRVRAAAVRALADVALVHGPAAVDRLVAREAAGDDGKGDATAAARSRSATPASPDRGALQHTHTTPGVLALLTAALSAADDDDDDSHSAADAAAEALAKLLLHRGAAPESGGHGGLTDGDAAAALVGLFSVVVAADRAPTAAPRARQALAVFFPLYAARSPRARALLAAAALPAARVAAVAAGKGGPGADVLRYAGDTVARAARDARDAARAARLDEPPPPAWTVAAAAALLEEAGRVGRLAAARQYGGAAATLAACLPVDGATAFPPADVDHLRTAARAAAAALPPSSLGGRAAAALARRVGRGDEGADAVTAALEAAALESGGEVVAEVEVVSADQPPPPLLLGLAPGPLPFDVADDPEPALDAAAAPAPRGRRAAATAASDRVRAAVARDSSSSEDEGAGEESVPISDSEADDENMATMAATPAAAAKSPTPAPMTGGENAVV